ncbi:flagellar biosynthesis protein FlhB [Tropicimonas sp. IMCC34043]|uniref:EscU/YscU/HrcU family type III secretion system export apparatus switch protein n=1 Tax=Tropicimonas sp. IMCC34043 TaxID=2248760 RepID=UPI000E26533A|nr:flagellar type III secretion system protein FlhB [Tropicimonas sp. IMCC34043]
MADEDQEDKQHEPSQKKLDDAREKGEIPRSADLSTAIAYSGFFFVATFGGQWVVTRLGDAGMMILSQPDRLSDRPVPGSGGLPVTQFLSWLGMTLLPVFAVPALLVLVSLVAQRALIFTPSKLQVKLSRISPLQNARNKYGKNGLFEFFKSLAKLIVISAALAYFLYSRRADIAASMVDEPGTIARLLGQLAVQFLGLVVLLAGLIGGLDLFWQHRQHLDRNRMSLKELRDEAKDAEGDPYMKQARRRRAQEIALNSMLADVPTASVIIVNPQHYAVALQWNRSFSGPPVCVAKGVDAMAARIREIAMEAGVPIHRDPPTARGLYATTEVGAQIEATHFGPVAVAIRFAEKMRARARRRMTP